MDLKDKVALVTGASRGIGRAIALELAARGACVIGTATTEAGALGVTEMLAPHGGQGVVLNVTDVQGCEALLDALAKESGGPHILVNNAGITRDNLSMRMKDEDWDAVLQTNLSAVFRLSRGVMRSMMKARWGRIINMTSVYGSRGTPNRIDYVTTKSALIGMTRAIAAEVVGQNITCNALCPGSVLTPNIESRIRALMREKKLEWEVATAEFLQGKQPGGKLIPAKHLAELALFLCTPAGGQMNGAVLPMENGWLAL